MLSSAPSTTAAMGDIVAVCYSSKFIEVLDTWTLVHFADGAFIELFLGDWKLSFILMTFFEVFESLLLTVFGNYVIFGQAANQDFESANATWLVDMMVNLAGILVVTLLRRGLGARLPPLWPRPWRRVGAFAWLRAAVQLVLVVATSAAALAVSQTHWPVTAVWWPNTGALLSWAVFMFWFAWLALLPAWEPYYHRAVWGAAGQPWRLGSVGLFALLAGIVTLAYIPSMLSLSYTYPMLFAYLYALLCLAALWTLWHPVRRPHGPKRAMP